MISAAQQTLYQSKAAPQSAVISFSFLGITKQVSNCQELPSKNRIFFWNPIYLDKQ